MTKKLCTATTKSGKPCPVPSLKGENVCLFHSKSDKAREYRGRSAKTRKFIFGKVRIHDQQDVVSFVEKYMEKVANIGVDITPAMTKSLSDLVGQYISLKQLALEQEAVRKSLDADSEK